MFNYSANATYDLSSAFTFKTLSKNAKQTFVCSTLFKARVPIHEELPGADQEREYHRRQGGGGGRGGVAEVEVAVAELLGPLPVTVRLAFLVVNFVFRGAAAPRDAALW